MRLCFFALHPRYFKLPPTHFQLSFQKKIRPPKSKACFNELIIIVPICFNLFDRLCCIYLENVVSGMWRICVGLCHFGEFASLHDCAAHLSGALLAQPTHCAAHSFAGPRCARRIVACGGVWACASRIQEDGIGR